MTADDPFGFAELERRRRDLARHESAHALVGYLVGAPPAIYLRTMWDHGVVGRDRGPRESHEYSGDVIAFLAGACADLMSDLPVPDVARWSRSDLDVVDRALENVEDRGAILDGFWRLTAELLRDNWQALETLTDDVIARGGLIEGTEQVEAAVVAAWRAQGRPQPPTSKEETPMADFPTDERFYRETTEDEGEWGDPEPGPEPARRAPRSASDPEPDEGWSRMLVDRLAAAHRDIPIHAIRAGVTEMVDSGGKLSDGIIVRRSGSMVTKVYLPDAAEVRTRAFGRDRQLIGETR
jgi:hypothetical protein